MPFLKFIGLFIYLSLLIFIYTPCNPNEWVATPYKNTYINRYGVPEASAHHENAEINMCTNFTSIVCKFEK